MSYEGTVNELIYSEELFLLSMKIAVACNSEFYNYFNLMDNKFVLDKDEN